MYVLGDISRLFDFSAFANPSVAFDFLSGLGTTLSIAIIGVLIGVILGVFLAIGKLMGNKFIKAICTIYINFVRGTPLLVQIYFIFYVPSFIYYQLTDHALPMSAFIAGFVAVGLNSAAYVSEIFRAGINSVDRGQFEAAKSLGFNYRKTLRLIILPQAFKNTLPALGNEFISVIKETAIISVIGAKDLMFYSNQLRNLTNNPFPSLIVVALIYFVVVYTLTRLVGLLEKRLAND